MIRMTNVWILCALVAVASIGRAEERKEAIAQANEVPLKSVHLLNLPDGVTESQVTAAIADVNRAIATAGYAAAGYRLWKLQVSYMGKEKTEYQYQYLWEGNWPSQVGYDAIHKHDAYKAAWKPHEQLFKKFPAHLYVRYAEVPAVTAVADAKGKTK